MKKKLLIYGILPAMALLVVGVGTASAHGLGGFFGSNATPAEIVQNHQQMFANEATLLGVSVDVVKQGWAEGKTLQEIATANGISATDLQAKMKAAAKQRMTDQLQAMVTQGVITQAQADARLKFMQTRIDNGMGKMGRGHMGLGF